MDVSFIGDGSHANRIKNILNNLEFDFNYIKHDREVAIQDQINVMNSDVIFILSPNHTHIDYLRQLSDSYKGYVYCEKPVINNFQDIEIFSLLDFTRYIIGYNLRYSEITKFIEFTKAKFDVGNLVNINVHMSYPFSIKDHYKKSWKSDSNKSPSGVVENLAVHYMDLAISLLGPPKKVNINLTNVNKTGTADDTAAITLIHKNGSSSQIFTSYATLAKESTYFAFERGDISYDGRNLHTYFPRETFNSKGLSICPPIVSKKEIESELLYSESLFNCVNYFFKTAANKKLFSHDLFNRSKISTLAMLGKVDEHIS